MIFNYFVLQQEKNLEDKKIIQGHLLHELDNWSMNESNDFTMKAYLFDGQTNNKYNQNKFY